MEKIWFGTGKYDSSWKKMELENTTYKVKNK